MDAKKTSFFQIATTLLAWWKGAARPLPWRRPRTFYGTVVSEFMLQQTRVTAVTPYYQRWMARWPTVTSAAAAAREEILLLWSGLGYYSRAHNLHCLCQTLTSLEPVPTSPEDWCRFPGVGPYTASAICAFAGLADTIPLDGNGLRILARLNAIHTIFANRQALEKVLRPAADSLAISGCCGAVGEALMDLGSAVCLPRNPRCDLCPLRMQCRCSAKPADANFNANRKILRFANFLRRRMLSVKLRESGARECGVLTSFVGMSPRVRGKLCR